MDKHIIEKIVDLITSGDEELQELAVVIFNQNCTVYHDYLDVKAAWLPRPYLPGPYLPGSIHREQRVITKIKSIAYRRS